MNPRTALAAAAAALLSVCAAPPAPGQPAPPAAADPAERAYLAGNGLLNRGLNELAAAEYRKFLAEHPRHAKAPLAMYGLGVALVRLGQFADAQQQLASITAGRDFPYAAEVSLMLAQCRFAGADYGAAADRLDDMLKQHASHDLADDAAALLAESRYRAGDHRRSVQAASLLAERWPQSPVRGRADLFSGLSLLELGDAKGAAAALRSAVSSTEAGGLRDHASLGLARALVRLDEGRDAEPLLRELLRSSDAAVAAEATVVLADLLHAGGDFDGARALLKPVLKNTPPGPGAAAPRFRIARVDFDSGEFKRARDAFERAGREDPQRADEAAYWAAKCCLRLDEPAEAAGRLISAIAGSPNSELMPEMRYDLAVAHLRAGQDREAAAAFDAFRTGFPEHALWPEATRLSASLALRTGDHATAIRAAEDLLRTRGASSLAPAARLIIAQAHAAAGRDAQAVTAYREFLSKHPSDVQAAHASLQLGSLLLDSGQPQEAAALLAQAAAAPDAAGCAGPALLMLGDLALAEERWADAEARFREYLALEGVAGRSDAMLKRGMALARLDRTDEAAAAFSSVAADKSAGPAAARALFERGTLELRTSNDAAAERSLRECLEREADGPLAPYAALHLATLLDRSGRRDDAARFYGRAADSGAPDVAGEAVFLHAQMLAGAGEHAAAIERFDRLAAMPDHPRSAEARARRAIARARSGDVAAAETELQAAAAANLDPDLRAAVLFERASCLKQLDRAPEAAGDLRTVVREFPDSTVAPFAALDLAEVESQAGRALEAAGVLEALLARAGDLAPDIVRHARYRLGALQLSLGRQADGVATLNALLEDAESLDPAIAASASLLCADGLVSLGRHDEAASLLRPVAADPPDEASGQNASLRLGECLASAQDWAGSESAFAGFLERYPGSEFWFQARFGLGWARENLGRHTDAIEQYRLITDRHQGKTAARAQFQIGECLFARGRHAEAAAELLKVDILYAYPEWSAAALYEAGRCFEAANDAAEARRQYRAVQDRFGDTRWATLARDRLAAATAAPVPGR